MTRPPSLRRRLLLWTSSAVCLAWLVVAAAGYFSVRHELDELLDAHLAQTAGLLAAQLSQREAGAEPEHSPQLHRYAIRVAFQVWEGDELRLHSATAPPTRLSETVEGFAKTTIAGVQWRVFSASVGDRSTVVKVAERIDARDEVSEEVAEHLAMPLTIALPLLGFLILITVDGGLKPLKSLTHQVAVHDSRHLEPIPDERVPIEVLPLIAQLNRLFERIQFSLDSERRFTADASHELRTPIAGIRAQAQVAQAAANSTERQQALDQLIRGCDRATQLIEQLMTLARLDADGEPSLSERCDLGTVVQSVMAALGPWAHQCKVELEFLAAPGIDVNGHPTLLSILIRNLIENAIRYSPPQSTVTVRLIQANQGAVLEIRDVGPGIPAEEREKVFRRFYRLESSTKGSGLGLSIARRIAELFGATLTLADQDNGMGLKVVVRFRPGRQARAESGGGSQC